MKHDHLPALNKYTSPTQYTALQEVGKTGSIINMVTQGRLGTTLGALIRSAWIDSEIIKNEEGVTSERWFVTDAGKHAMQLYEIKREQDRVKEEAEAEVRRIREAQKLQKMELAREVQDRLTDYNKFKTSVERKMRMEWADIITVATKAGIDKVQFRNMVLIAEQRNGVKKDDLPF